MENNQSIKLVDKRYRLNRSENYHLNIKLTENSFSYQVYDPGKRKFLALFDTRQADAALDFVPYAEGDELLNQTFRKIRVMVSSPYQVLIPKELYTDKDKDTYARTAFAGGSFRKNGEGPDSRQRSGDPELLLNEVPALNAYLLSGINPGWSVAVNKHFSGASLFHEGCPFIAGLLEQFAGKAPGSRGSAGSGTCLCLHIEPGYLEIAFIAGGKLHFYNRFTCENPVPGTRDDAGQFIYFPLFVCEQLEIDPHEVRVLVYGLLDPSSEKYKQVCKYFKHVDFGELPGRFRYSKQLYDIPQHYFFSLMNLELCG